MCRSRAAVLLAWSIVSSLLAAGCRDLEVVTNSYATVAEARAAGAIDRGWVPAGLPDGASDIREAHDLDTNRRWGLFAFPLQEADTLRGLLAGERDPSGISCDIPARIEWWPILLRGPLDAEKVRATGLRAYQSAEAGLVYLINWEQGRAYYWTPASS